MADNSAIEWTDATWNPLIGCEHVGPGCDHCYAATLMRRNLHESHRGLAVRHTDGTARFTGEVRLRPDMLDQPLRWRKPRRIFVNSLSDLFHRDVPDEFIARVFAVMAVAQHHTFQVLTKRPQRMADLLTCRDFRAMVGSEILAMRGMTAATRDAAWVWPLPNVWLGTSIENDLYRFRADHLRRTPATVRFISAEPLLGPLPSLDLTGIDWLIVGGESGPGARPMHPDWVRDLRDRATACDDGHPMCGQQAAFFFKQWGEWEPFESDDPPFWRSVSTGTLLDGHHLPPEIIDGDPVGGWWAPLDGEDTLVTYLRAGKKAAGRVLDGRTWDEMP